MCDDVHEARDLAFGRGERHKVVSKDGTLFNKVSGRSFGHLLLVLWWFKASL